MATKNSSIMTASWLEGTNDFQQRIPDPTQASMSDVSSALFDPMNNDLYNAWSNNLINRIGMTIAEAKRFENPLAIFRKPDLGFGFTIQQIAVKWAKAHSYKDDSEDLLKYERPEFVTAFHSIDRADKYKVSITRPEMRQAIANGDGFGLNQLIDLAVSSCTNAEAYDEMNIMLNALGKHVKNHGIYCHTLSAAPTDKATAQELLAGVKRYVNQFAFPSTKYNAMDIDDVPTFAKESECVILVTPEVMANLDVYAFAELFNIDRAEVRARVVMVPEFPWSDVHAVLTTEDVFMCARSEYGMFPFFDPNTLTTHEFLHAQGVYSINPFVPLVAFATGGVMPEFTITQDVTGIDVTAEDGKVELGGTEQLTIKLEGTITENGAGIEVKPDSATWSVSATSADGTEAVALNSRTYVDKYGVLHCQKSLEAGTKLAVTAVATYDNPSSAPGTTAELVSTIEVEVVE